MPIHLDLPPEEQVNGHPLTFEEVWPEAARHLEPALEFAGGTHTIEHVRAAIDQNRAQLWPVGEEGALVTEVIETPTGLRICRIWLGGGKLGALLAAEPVVAEWARDEGCTMMEIVGRRAWQRVLPEYKHHAVVLRRAL